MPTEIAEGETVETPVGEVQPETSTEQQIDDAAGRLAALESQPETEPEAEPETEPETETEPEPEAEIPHGYRKQIGKLTARAKTAEEENARLKAELAEAKAKGPQLSEELLRSMEPQALVSFGVKAGVATEADLKVVQEATTARSAATWLENNPEQAMQELAKQMPDASEAKIGIEYSRRLAMWSRKAMEAAELAMPVKQRIIAAVSSGKQVQPAARQTMQTRPGLTARPKATPMTVATGGSTGGGSGVRGGGRLPVSQSSMAARHKALGGGDDAAIEVAAEALGDIPTAEEARKSERASLARGGRF